MTLEVSFTLPENIYSTGITHDDHHMMIIIYLKHRPQQVGFKWLPVLVVGGMSLITAVNV
jgi:hypothetical protein